MTFQMVHRMKDKLNIKEEINLNYNNNSSSNNNSNANEVDLENALNTYSSSGKKIVYCPTRFSGSHQGMLQGVLSLKLLSSLALWP